jgi:hypothetical protein
MATMPTGSRTASAPRRHQALISSLIAKKSKMMNNTACMSELGTPPELT